VRVMAGKSKDRFVKVPLWWAEAAAKATRTPGFMVCIELLHASWKAKSVTVLVSNKRLRKAGVSREIKRRVLRDLEAAGLITIERRRGCSPRATLVVL
jgi:ribosomal protein S19E (S16A)